MRLTQKLAIVPLVILVNSIALTSNAQDAEDNIEYGTVLPVGIEPESLVLDQNTGDYVLTYKTTNIADKEILVRLPYEPATKIEPTLISRFEPRKDGVFEYHYKIRNGRGSKQHLNGILMFIRQTNPSSQLIPSGWMGSVVSLDPLKTEGEVSVSWNYRPVAHVRGLMPGRKQSGFAFESADLPGIGSVRLTGAVKKIVAYTGDGPDPESEVGKQFEEVRSKNFVPFPAAIPRIQVGTPYDGAAVLDGLRTHITKDIVDLKLIEPALASELDRILQAAADAIRRNSIKAARDHLHDAFKLMRRAHPDIDREDDDEDDDEGAKKKGKAGDVHPIDRLAARVIAFDIKYVEKRLK